MTGSLCADQSRPQWTLKQRRTQREHRNVVWEAGTLCLSVCLSTVSGPFPQPRLAFKPPTAVIHSAPPRAVPAQGQAPRCPHLSDFSMPFRPFHQISLWGLMSEVCVQFALLTKKKVRALSVARQHPPPSPVPGLRLPLRFLWPTVGRKPAAPPPPRSSLRSPALLLDGAAARRPSASCWCHYCAQRVGARAPGKVL